MEPTNDHERAIAKAVDEKFQKDPSISYASIVTDISMSVDFLMSTSDMKFLIRYSKWRSGHPVDPAE